MFEITTNGIERHIGKPFFFPKIRHGCTDGYFGRKLCTIDPKAFRFQVPFCFNFNRYDPANGLYKKVEL